MIKILHIIFGNILVELQQQFRHVDNNLYEFAAPRLLRSFYISDISIQDIVTEISRLNTNKAVGSDNIGAKFIRMCPEILAYNLAKIFNSAIEKAEYPTQLKIARVIALYKKGNHYLANNYGPISLLSSFNKIFEKLICRQLVNFLEKNNILFQYQLDFRKMHSTTLALIEITDNLRKFLNDGNYALSLFIDLTKALDTLDHEILLYKMNNYGIRGHANRFFRSYLTGRKQFTSINGIQSTLRDVQCGVPQGSVLRPIMFLIYINDLHTVIGTEHTRLFADDASIILCNKNFTDLIDACKEKYKHIIKWCYDNKLTINHDKTCFILFHTKNKSVPRELLNIDIDGIFIQRVTYTKYLGVVIDEKLNWHEHVNYVCSSLIKFFGIFSKIKHFMNKNTARNIYFALINSRINYGIEVYGKCAASYMSKIQTLQNKLMKMLLQLHYRTPTDDLHAMLNILKVNDMFKTNILSFVNRCLLFDVPPVFYDYFKYQEVNYNLRFKRLEVPRFRNNYGMFRVAVQGADLWNNIPDTLSCFTVKKCFKEHVVKHHIGTYTNQ